MRHNRLVTLALLALCMPFSASAGDGDLWMGPAALICVAKNPALAETPYGTLLMKNPQFSQTVGSLKTPVEVCSRSQPTLSAELCTELLNQDPKGKFKPSAFYEKYGREIMGLETLFSCLSKEMKRPDE